MIDVVLNENREMYARELEQMYRQRHDIFIKKMGWQLKSENGLEIDQYDTPSSIYLLALENGVNLKASARLIPTTAPHLMIDQFRDYCDEEPPRGEGVWECSRYYNLVRRSQRKAGGLSFGGEIVCSMVEFGLLYGIEEIIFFTNLSVLSSIVDGGWEATPLGLPQEVDGQTNVAYSLRVSATSLQNFRHARDISGPVIQLVRTARAA